MLRVGDFPAVVSNQLMFLAAAFRRARHSYGGGYA
jgi:hypothetical protein